jgi:hypothetical protein
MPTIHVATRKGLFSLRREPAGWRIAASHFVGDAVTQVLADARTGALHAALGTGHFGVKMRRSDDGGASWRESTTPCFPAPASPDEETTADGKPWPWRVEQVWSLAAGGRPGALWCGTVGGGLFVSDDDGARWSLVRGLWDHPSRRGWFGGGADRPAIHSICVHPSDPDDVVVGVSCGGAWRTRDGGATWAVAARGMFAEFMPEARRFDPEIQDPHRIVQCDAAPEVLWCQHHNGVFVSRDRGDAWTSLPHHPPSVFGFAVAAHPRDPNRAWFVPAQKDETRVPVDAAVVVTRTDDGGATFSVQREGLPQSHAYDLTLRHALDIADDGETLAFGSSTGSLWVTEDGGARWTHLTAHLPPIYAVHIEG